MHPKIARSEAANQPRPRVYRRRKYKTRHDTRHRHTRKLTVEDRSLNDIIQELMSHYLQLPERDLQKQENSVAHSVCQSNHPCFSVQDHQRMDSDLGGSTEELDGLELNDLLDHLSSDEVENPNNNLTNQQNTMAEFLKKIDDDVASSIDFPDFMICFDEERKKIGRCSFPLSLVPTMERIIDVYGDLSTACLMNSNVTENIYLFFAATIKEMEEFELHQITEEKMLKWRDAIKDALRINFKADFALERLKRIACAYFGHIGN